MFAIIALNAASFFFTVSSCAVYFILMCDMIRHMSALMGEPGPEAHPVDSVAPQAAETTKTRVDSSIPPLIPSSRPIRPLPRRRTRPTLIIPELAATPSPKQEPVEPAGSVDNQIPIHVPHVTDGPTSTSYPTPEPTLIVDMNDLADQVVAVNTLIEDIEPASIASEEYTPTYDPAPPIIIEKTLPQGAQEPEEKAADPIVIPEPTPVSTVPEPTFLPADGSNWIPEHQDLSSASNILEETLIPVEDATPAEPPPVLDESQTLVLDELDYSTTTPTTTPALADPTIPAPTTPIAPTQITAPSPTLDTPLAVDVPARAPILAARSDATANNTTQASAGEIPPPSISSLVELLGQMSIQELVEHEMDDWTAIFDMDIDEQPTVDMATELLEEQELGMWDSVDDLERWTTKTEPSTMESLDKPDTIMDPPVHDISPMVLEAHEDVDAVMEPLTSLLCEGTEMDTDPEWMDLTTSPLVSAEIDWTSGTLRPWVWTMPLAASVSTWSLEGYAADVDMEENHASPIIEDEDGEMEWVVEESRNDLVEESFFHTPTPPTESVIGTAEELEEEPEEEVMDELADEIATMWTPLAKEPTPEDSESDREETEDEPEDLEAELDALEEEHFAAAADDFLAGLAADFLGAQE